MTNSKVLHLNQLIPKIIQSANKTKPISKRIDATLQINVFKEGYAHINTAS